MGKQGGKRNTKSGRKDFPHLMSKIIYDILSFQSSRYKNDQEIGPYAYYDRSYEVIKYIKHCYYVEERKNRLIDFINSYSSVLPYEVKQLDLESFDVEVLQTVIDLCSEFDTVLSNALCMAIDFDRPNLFQWILKKYPRISIINGSNLYGRTPLMYATWKKNDEYFKALLKNRHISLMKKDHEGWNAVMHAIRYDNIQYLNALVDKNASLLDTRFHHADRTLLMHAAACHSHRCLNELLRLGEYDVNEKDGNGHNAMMLAVNDIDNKFMPMYDRNTYEDACLKTVRTLIHQHNASVNEKDCDDKTVLMHAIMGDRDTDVILELLHHDASSINEQDNDGWTALMHCLEDSDLMRVLLRFNASVDMKDDSGCTALLHAAKYRNSECIQTYLDHGANINEQDNDGRTAVMHAAKNLNSECIQTYLDHGANINEQDNDGRTAVMHAVSSADCDYGAEPCVSVLIANNAALDIQDNNGDTAIGLAYHKLRCPKVFATLFDAYPDAVLIVNNQGFRPVSWLIEPSNYESLFKKDELRLPRDSFFHTPRWKVLCQVYRQEWYNGDRSVGM